ncbi:SNF2-related protein [Pontibacter sp. G13]|uniref:SNF2-related protein n=1 Tax=Pontibacter sp. G13 TaxID=3074898 RepID=UPI00288B66B3|nr:SNF2-related protein [Pontibacter sp. G13]WNJ17356.1 SNF2-related protein [Pontibacter sp. G13]
MQKSYGTTWWGKRWLEALEEFDEANRLARGKSYANNGAVKRLDLRGSKLIGSVRDSGYRPYEVELDLKPFSDAKRKALLKLLEEHPLYLAQLLNGELPVGFLEMCHEAGIHIFPESWEDIQSNCSCPDWAIPCKHIAAVCYVLATEIDKSPFKIFTLRGMDLLAELKKMGIEVSNQQSLAFPALRDLWEELEMLPEDWTPPEDADYDLDVSHLPNTLDLLLKILKDRPIFYPPGNFKDELTKAYRLTADFAKVILLSDAAEMDPTPEMDLVEEVLILLNPDGSLRNCTLRDREGARVKRFDDPAALLLWLGNVPLTSLDKLSPQLAALRMCLLFAAKLAERSAFVPQILEVQDQHFAVRWIPTLMNQDIRELCDEVKRWLPQGILCYQVEGEYMMPIEEDVVPSMLSFFLGSFMKESCEEVFIWHHRILRLFFGGHSESFHSTEEAGYPTAILMWLNRLFISEKSIVPVLEVLGEQEGFAISLHFEDRRDETHQRISIDDLTHSDEYTHHRMEAFGDVGLLVEYLHGIEDLANGNAEFIEVNSQEMVDIMFEVVPTIRMFGIQVELPESLQHLMKPQLSMALTVNPDEQEAESLVGVSQMLDFEWRVALGSQVVETDHFFELAQQKTGIVKFKDQYVYFDDDEVQHLIKRLEDPPSLTAHEKLHVALAEEYKGATVKLDGKVRQLIRDLMATEDLTPPNGLHAELRPYQLRGFQWLTKNARLGFGSIIADDMGLGKTLQVISVILHMKETGTLGDRKVIVIAPTTLLSNWEKEIKKFAPSLSSLIYHGPGRDLTPLKDSDILLTSYGIARNETKTLNKFKWLCLVIDEAQNIKNPTTGQSKAVKKIKAPIRIAMSGTPVENRLSEYWSIFDFTNKGYLGGIKKFTDAYAKPIEILHDRQRLAHFRKITDPFILRRVKTDRSIIQDLPEKIEQDQYCPLTVEQARLYKQVMKDLMSAVQGSEGMERKGLVLKMITALKQVCNHPVHYLKEGKAIPADSGKSQRLLELMHSILERGEKTLIFTQYREMGNLIIDMMEKEFGFDVQFLHGGTTRKQRDVMVEDFQNNRANRVLILSLKAGGTGLNLTAASNIIHYDLWWNPAVEAQATDRAYRIGQDQNVMVHRFITENSFEERINQMIQAKRELADLAVSAGEKWIGELSDDELRQLVALGG